MGMFDGWMGEKKPDTAATAVATGTGTAGAGNNGAGNGAGVGTGNGAGNGQNNAGVDDAIFASIWDEPKPAVKTAAELAAAAAAGTQQTGAAGAQLTPEQQVSKFLTEQGLGEFKLSDTDKAALKEGNFDEVMGRLNGRVQQAYIKSMQGMNALVEKKVQDAVTKAVGDSKEYVEGKELKGMLHRELPFTADPSISPVAESVFKRFLQQPNTTREKALANTKRYFERTAQLVGGVNKNSGGTFRENNSGPVGDTDWMVALTGKSG